MPTLSVEIDDSPVFVPLLEVSQGEPGQLRATEAAAQKERQDGIVPLVPNRVAGRNGEELLALLRREPIPETHPEAFHSLDPPYPCGKIRVQQAVVGRLTGQPANRGQSEVDRGRCQATGLQFVPYRNNRPAEGKCVVRSSTR